MNLWLEVAQLKGQTLKTLDQRKPFDIVEVTEHAIIVRSHKRDLERPIQRETIESAYMRLESAGEITRIEIHQHFSLFNPAYVAAILAALPNVKYEIHPIRLWVQKSEE